jgi:O-methyltransferase
MLAAIARTVMKTLGVDLLEQKNPDFDERTLGIIRRVTPFTMTSAQRVFALVQAVDYVVKAGIPGSIVECGVWKGGSMMAVAEALLSAQVTDRELYLFDTYEGMTRPGEADVSFAGEPASRWFDRLKTNADSSDWCRASMADVEQNLIGTGYPRDRMTFVKGKVEDTIPDAAPEQIAILRLDTDWYESTYHELLHLYPRLAPGGVLVIDDYGHWQGSKRAVDDYFAQHGRPVLLNRVDYSGRVAVKV